MPRRRFTARDLAPLRQAAERVLERQPDAAVVGAAAAPFKRRIPTARHEERSEVRLAVEVESSANPDGVPLHEIARAVRQEHPGVTGVSLTPGGVSLKFDTPPTPAQRRQIDALLADAGRLESLRPGLERTAGRDATARVVDSADLRRVLHDPQTTDAAWLRAFRSYAMEHLVEPADGNDVRPPRS